MVEIFDSCMLREKNGEMDTWRAALDVARNFQLMRKEGDCYWNGWKNCIRRMIQDDNRCKSYSEYRHMLEFHNFFESNV